MRDNAARRKKVWRRKFGDIAARDRRFTVSNITKSISPKIDHKVYYNGDMSNAITCPFTGHKFVPTNPHPIPIGFLDATITGYEWVEPKAQLWKHERHKQPKRLIKTKKNRHGEKRNDFVKYFPNYPYTTPKMNQVQYMEKLVEHKTLKWERKHPQPMEMFVEDVEKWKQERETAIERIRDFVVSVYDKLLLTGRFKVNESKYNEEKVAEIKDINGEGHKVNQLDPKTSKLMKEAQKITNKVKSEKPNLVATNLRDHKKQKGRIILPQAA